MSHDSAGESRAGARAVVLCSGGIDSTTVLAIARSQGYRLYALSFDYGQRHAVELQAAARVAAAFHVESHLVLPLALDRIGGSALTTDTEVPKDRSGSPNEEIPVTYVPARNTIFLSYALAWAEVIGARDVFIGANAIDYSGYPDCRPEYIAAFEHMAQLATKAGVEGDALRIRAPLIAMTKADIIREGIRLGADFSVTHSCYDPDPHGAACGRCDSCLIRKKGFCEAGVADPTVYVP